MTIIHTLASGSSGNALAFSWEGGLFLIDAGISCRRITHALTEIGFLRGEVSGILITHTHSDHISGLQTLLKHTDCPVLASEAACRALRSRFPDILSRLSPLPLCETIEFNGCCVTAVPTSHDSPGSCGFRLDTADGSFALLTDTGYVTEEARVILPGVALAVLEANHDLDALRTGPYPEYLQARIAGPRGHLCNEDAAEFAGMLARAGAREIVLAHLSAENNTPLLAERAVRAAVAGTACRVSVAPRNLTSRAYYVDGGGEEEEELSLCGA